ncbi:hypothetical protein [Kitasatospora sp. P5_F3]
MVEGTSLSARCARLTAMSDSGRSQSTYSVPAGRPFHLAELRAKLAATDDVVRNLWNGAHPTEFELVADGLWVAFTAARSLAPAKTYTGCDRHPNGAIDPEPPRGWTRCLICNEARRLSTTGSLVPPVAKTNPLGYLVPDGPFTLELLQDFLRRTSELGYGMSLRSTDAEFLEMADTVHQAFCVARELARPRNTSGCERHPGAPTDPAAGNACLFCVADERRRRDEKDGVPVMIPRASRGPVSRRPQRPAGPGQEHRA